MIQPFRSQLKSHRLRCRPGSLVLMIVALMVLVACGTDSADDIAENRQFANDPVPTRTATEAPTETPAQPTAATGQVPQYATPETILRTRGAPSTLYMLSDGKLIALALDGDNVDERGISLPDGAEVLGFDASPTGDRVGVLMATAGEAAPAVQFFDSSGETIGGPYRADFVATLLASPAASPAATPQADDAGSRGPATITWMPQGSGVVAVYDGRIVVANVDTGAQLFDTSAIDGEIVYAAMSPMGDRMLVQASHGDGTQRTYLAEQGSGDVRELRALRSGEGMGISELVWLPSGNGVLFVEGEIDGGVVMRGQLFSYLFRNEVPTLIATSGQGGPSASITTIAVSADGYSVAYDVSIRDLDEWSAHSMWVRSLKEQSPAIQVPVDAGQPVTRITWTHEGLFWAQASGDETSRHLVVPSGTVHPITLGGTPDASPVTSVPPMATPEATPAASPVGWDRERSAAARPKTMYRKR